MELKLESGLPHQEYAVEAISEVFKQVEINQQVAHYSNPVIDLRSNRFIGNIYRIQQRERQNVAEKYRNEQPVGNTLCLDIKMETGTGKTYVYTHTIFELHKRYGINKFIIAVPSIAIKAGTSTFLNETYVKAHFKNTLGYDAEINVGVLEAVKKQKKGRKYFPTAVRAFVEGSRLNRNKIYVLIVNSALLTTGKMLTRNDYDVTIEGYDRPFDALRSTRPFVIIDEPHTFSRDQKAYKAIISELTPQCIIRFGATFPMTTIGKGKKKTTVRDYEHLLYDLNAQRSFSSGLIKGVMKEHFEPTSTINEKVKILDINDKKATFQHITQTSKASHVLSVGDSLSILSPELTGLTITGITKDLVILSNGMEKHKKDEFDVDIYTSSYQESMLRLAIQRHFETERDNFHREKGRIKTLALFFIDDILSFRGDDEGNNAWLRDLFDRLLEAQLKTELQKENSPGYATYLRASLNDLAACRAGYFAQDNSDPDDAVKKEVDDILHNKTELLSFVNKKGQPNTRRFLFSKWTLKEGWDNPNVFQICTLRHSNSTTAKRQEVGRGLRLCVDKNGVRMDKELLGDDVHEINKLTVIANESYADFTSALQKETREVLRERAAKATVAYFTGKQIKIGEELHTIDELEASRIIIYLEDNGYIDEDKHITPEYREAIASGNVAPLPPKLQPIAEGVTRLINSIFDPKALDDMVVEEKTTIRENKLNENFGKEEFQALWKEINHQYVYTVSYDSEELIENAILHINAELDVKQLRYIMVEGTQDEKQVTEFGDTRSQSHLLTDVCTSTVRYDLVGDIAKGANLTRRTVVKILQGIKESKLYLFKNNPEEFIRKVISIIKEQKSTMIVETIHYNMTEGKYDSSIFTVKSKMDFDKAYEAKKHITDYVFSDSKGERQFAHDLDQAKEVVVYAKLPRTFQIPTPVGNYAPDWAIAMEVDGIKHIFFIAETKGSMSSMDLTKIELAKIECAEKLFNSISTSKVKYHKVASYSDLLDEMGKEC